MEPRPTCGQCPTFSWYWLADLCAAENIPFVLGHALYMKAVHGGKTKNDKIDSEKIAMLLRGGMFPQAYAYPKEMRGTRDLLRRRMRLMRMRAEALGHLQITNWQYNLPPLGRVCYKGSSSVVVDSATLVNADIRRVFIPSLIACFLSSIEFAPLKTISLRLVEKFRTS